MELTKYLNRNVKPKWLVVENSPINSKEKFNVEDERFHLIEGDTTLLPQIEGQGSYHHAQGLTKAMLYVKTRYLLIIDPDFFIIKDSWINEVIKHMYSNKLSFFGAPYFPTHKTKYRYFPSVICFFVDLNYVKKERLDFFPELHEMSYFRSLGTYTIAKLVIKSYYEKNKSRIDYNRIKCKKLVLIERFLSLVIYRGRPRLFVGSTRDTGHSIYEMFSNNSGRYLAEHLNPVWENPLFTKNNRLSVKHFIIRKFFPELISPYPKKSDYTSSKYFRTFNLPDINKLNWEEYLWKEKPFGFHIRGIFQKKKTVEFELLDKLINEFKNKLISK